MRGGAGAGGFEGSGLGVGHVGHVVWGVEVYAVPAGGEAEGGHDAFLAFAVGEVDDFRLPRVEGVEAGVS